MCTVLQIQLLAAVTAQSPRDDNLKRAVTPHGPCPWQHTTITTNQSTPDRIPRHRRPPLPSGSPLSHRSRATGHPHSVTGHALQGIPTQSQVTRYRASPLSHRSRATGHPSQSQVTLQGCRPRSASEDWASDNSASNDSTSERFN